MPLWDPNHPDMLAAFANADLRDRGVGDLRFDNPPVFRSRRTMAETAQTIETALTEPKAPLAPATGPSPGEAMRARLAAVLRAPEAKGKTDAALALTLRTDMTPEHIAQTLRDLPAGVDLDLAPKAISDPEAKAEADRIRQIVTADAAQGHADHALALAFDTDTPVTAALAILMAMPKLNALPSLDERAAECGEFGPSDLEMEHLGRGGRTAEIWSKAVADANAQFATAGRETPPADPGAPK